MFFWNCFANRRQPMCKISLARRPRFEDECIQVHVTRFWGQKASDFYKLRLAPIVERKCSQQWNSRQKDLGETSSWMTSLSQSKYLKAHLKSTRKLETSWAKVDSYCQNGKQVTMKSCHRSKRQTGQRKLWKLPELNHSHLQFIGPDLSVGKSSLIFCRRSEQK